MPINECRNAVFILGAGFSAPAKLPVMRGFMPAARDRYFQLKAQNNPLAQSFEDLCEFQIECRKSSWILERDWDNIEELYTQAHLQQLAKGEKTSKLCDSIRWSIWDIYRRHAEPNLLHPFWKVLNRYKDRGLKPIVITTNYDTLVEVMSQNTPDSKNQWHYFYPGFTPPWEGKGRIRYEDSSVRVNYPSVPAQSFAIIKLHGSVNWFETKRPARILADIVVPDPRDSREKISGNDFDVEWFESVNTDNARVTPMIVPPMIGKMAVHSVISSQWTAAVEALAEAREVLVIGYSFPSTDVFMARLLTEGLKNNQDLRSFVIADRQTVDDWNDRMRTLFSQTARCSKVSYLSIDSWKLIHKIDASATDHLKEGVRVY